MSDLAARELLVGSGCADGRGCARAGCRRASLDFWEMFVLHQAPLQRLLSSRPIQSRVSVSSLPWLVGWFGDPCAGLQLLSLLLLSLLLLLLLPLSLSLLLLPPYVSRSGSLGVKQGSVVFTSVSAAGGWWCLGALHQQLGLVLFLSFRVNVNSFPHHSVAEPRASHTSS